MKKRKTEKTFPLAVEQDKKKLFQTKIQDNFCKFKAGVKTPTQEFLEEIKEEIRESLINGVPYSILRKSIKDIFEVELSTSTLKAFAQKYLDLPAKSTKKAEANEQQAQDISNERLKASIDDI